MHDIDNRPSETESTDPVERELESLEQEIAQEAAQEAAPAPKKRSTRSRKKNDDEEAATRRFAVKIATKTLELNELEGTAREVLTSIIPGTHGDIPKTVASIVSAPAKKYGTPLMDVKYIHANLNQDPVELLVEIASWESDRLKEAWNALRLLGVISKNAKQNSNLIHASRQLMQTVEGADLSEQTLEDIETVLSILK
ncbi:hypothetical protein ACTXM3_09275 [Glutamicibacter arilaitensis]|uniref:hypothetical protein n=1 Tax=Glutamicibacter arilaitensis TaxID=256701 RepID=UPI003FD20652